LARDHRPTEYLPGRLDLAPRREDVFVRLVVVVPHHYSIAQTVAHEPAQLVARYPVVEKVETNLGAGLERVEEVEREEAALVLPFHLLLHLLLAAAEMEVFVALALDEDGIRPDLQHLPDGQKVRLAEVLERRDEGAIVSLLALVP